MDTGATGLSGETTGLLLPLPVAMVTEAKRATAPTTTAAAAVAAVGGVVSNPCLL